METCTPIVTWNTNTHLSKHCPPLAECLKFPSSSSNHSVEFHCDCTHSEFFLHNAHNNQCAPSPATFFVIGFWATLGLWCVFAAVRMWQSMAIPQPIAAEGGGAAPRTKGGHFQRCKWVNLVSIVWTCVWCFVRVAMISLDPATASERARLIVMDVEFATHAVVTFLFFFSVMELALTIALVLRRTGQMRSSHTAAKRQLLYAGGLATILTPSVVIPDGMHQTLTSCVLFAVVVLSLLCAFGLILWGLTVQRRHSIYMANAMQQIKKSYERFTAVLAFCLVASICLIAVEVVARFSPHARGLSVARFLTASGQHVLILVFQFSVAKLATELQLNRRKSIEQSGVPSPVVVKRCNSRESTRSNQTTMLTVSSSSRATKRQSTSQANPVVIFVHSVSYTSPPSSPKKPLSLNEALQQNCSQSVQSPLPNDTPPRPPSPLLHGSHSPFQSSHLRINPSPLRQMSSHESFSSADEE